MQQANTICAAGVSPGLFPGGSGRTSGIDTPAAATDAGYLLVDSTGHRMRAGRIHCRHAFRRQGADGKQMQHLVSELSSGIYQQDQRALCGFDQMMGRNRLRSRHLPACTPRILTPNPQWDGPLSGGGLNVDGNSVKPLVPRQHGRLMFLKRR